MLLDTDLHIHSRFSIASSRSMVPSSILAGCLRKGLAAVGSGDALHGKWREMWGEAGREDGVLVIPSAEVEDAHRVHHLILAGSFDTFGDLAGRFSPSAPSIASMGRPHLRLAGEEIAREVHDAGGLIGPAHAFTPWTSLYASFDHVRDCYGDERPDFLELGLSADSSYGAGISELRGIPFLSNSDAHSPSPAKMGREFNRIEVPHRTVGEVLESIRKGRIAMNAGFFPEEGKYNRTACTRCFREFSLEEAAALSWRCPDDGGLIKKGVSDRARELSDMPPEPRPPYLHLIPLAEILQRVLGTSSPNTKKVAALYDAFLGAFGTEIRVLVDVPVEELQELHPVAGDAIARLRTGRVRLFPGGGGRYGRFSFE
ncbi:MAG TPA: PHP-associated domain-containing protein [Methanomicrobiales archaeon]|nr:PHP-associated domain-containing protein [Methanomicrobiales archaeon]